ncbi:MAG TPA: hypothetical protein VM733_22345 [Thermoanaerobaculia bacterium]|nr:hypothetical protein [Thermoanaerobaculia bacterium]
MIRCITAPISAVNRSKAALRRRSSIANDGTSGISPKNNNGGLSAAVVSTAQSATITLSS